MAIRQIGSVENEMQNADRLVTCKRNMLDAEAGGIAGGALETKVAGILGLMKHGKKDPKGTSRPCMLSTISILLLGEAPKAEGKKDVKPIKVPVLSLNSLLVPSGISIFTKLMGLSVTEIRAC